MYYLACAFRNPGMQLEPPLLVLAAFAAGICCAHLVVLWHDFACSLLGSSSSLGHLCSGFRLDLFGWFGLFGLFCLFAWIGFCASIFGTVFLQFFDLIDSIIVNAFQA